MPDFNRKPTEEEREDKRVLEAAVKQANEAAVKLRAVAQAWVAIRDVNKDRPKEKLPVGWIGQLKEGASPPYGFERTDGEVVTTEGLCKGITKPTVEDCAIKVVKDW